MSTAKYLLFGALGVAAVVLLTSDKAKDIRNEVDENAKRWAKKLKKMGYGTADTLSELRNLLDSEIEGLSDDARERITAIIDGTGKSAKKIKNNISSQLS